MSFECCIPCKKPKRYPGRHSQCNEYAEAKAKHEQQKSVANKKKAIDDGITAQILHGVNRAARRKGSK